MPNKLSTINIPAVNVFKVGCFNGDEYSVEDLDNMVENFSKVNLDPTVKAIKIGHQDGQEALDEAQFQKIFGAPSLGYIDKLYRKENILYADLRDVPEHFGELINSGAYSHISAEIYWNYSENDDDNYHRVLRSIAFLGADIPAITSLEAVRTLYNTNEAGSLYKYDENENEYRIYDINIGKSENKKIYTFKKSKENVNYNKVSNASTGRCGNCRFFDPYDYTCTLVEGTIESNYTCDLFESRPTGGYAGYYEELETEVKDYIIKKVGKKWVLYDHRGNVLGRHESEESAKKQENAINMSKAKKNEEENTEVREMANKKEVDTEKKEDVKEEDVKETELKTHSDTSDPKVAELEKQLKDAEDAKKKLELKLNSQSEENSGLKVRIEKLEKDTEKSRETLRATNVDNWIEKVQKDGKLEPKFAPMVRSLMLSFPEEAVHKYSLDENEVSESLTDTFKKIFENRESIMTELSEKSEEKVTQKYSNAQEEIMAKVSIYMKENKDVEWKDALRVVQRENPELAERYSRMQN